MPTETLPFVHRRQVMWGETDVAGSVDLGTITRYSMEALEHWFRDRLGFDWHQLHVQQQVGTPFVRAELQFHSIVQPSAALAVAVSVEKVGRSSVIFHVAGRTQPEDRQCWEGRFTCVFTNPATQESTPIPDVYRLAIEEDAAFAAKCRASQKAPG